MVTVIVDNSVATSRRIVVAVVADTAATTIIESNKRGCPARIVNAGIIAIDSNSQLIKATTVIDVAVGRGSTCRPVVGAVMLLLRG